MKHPTLKRIYGGQGGSSGGSATVPVREGGRDTDDVFDKNYGDASNRGGPVQAPKLEKSSVRPGFQKGYGDSGGAIQTLEHGSPLPGSQHLLPIEEGSLPDSRFARGYGGPAGPIETLEFGSMSPREKQIRYPAEAGARALRKRF